MITVRIMVVACLFMLAFAGKPHAQDTLVMKDGSEIYCKVIEIGMGTVSYKRADNLQGPTYTVNTGKIFMSLYPGGKHELFTNGEDSLVAGGSEEKISGGSGKVDSLSDGPFRVLLTETKVSRDKKNAVVISANVDAYINGRLFTNVTVAIYQRTDVSLDFEGHLNDNYLSKSAISFSASERIQNFLYEKYENLAGKGYGWALPPQFFGKGACSIAWLDQRAANKEFIGVGGYSTTRLPLKDCSSPEKKILSATLLWLKLNFGK